MPTTPTYNLRYPGPDDDPNGPEDMQNLAEDVEAAIAALIPDSGVQTNLAVTPGATWSLLANEHRVIGKMMFLRLWVENTGSAIVGSTGGSGSQNIIGDPTVATIDDATRRPVMDTFSAYQASVTSGSVRILAATGEVKIGDLHTDSEIATGGTVDLYMAYPIP